MQIKIETLFNISPENIALIPIVANKLGYQEWIVLQEDKAKATSIELANTQNADLPEEERVTAESLYVVPDTDVNTFINDFFTADFSTRIKNLVSPSVEEYFGLKDKQTADFVKGQLDEAVIVNVEIN